MKPKAAKGVAAYQMGLTKGYDQGFALERERILTILRGHRDSYDAELERERWTGLDEAIRDIESGVH